MDDSSQEHMLSRRRLTTTIIARCGVALLAPICVFGSLELVSRAFMRPGSLTANLTGSVARDGYFYLASDKVTHVTAQADASLIGTDGRRPADLRIALFGESATAGTPYVQELAYGHFLHRMLSQKWPGVQIETFNFGYFAQTYDFAARAVDDALQLHPDYLILYCGNNELYPWNLGRTAHRWVHWTRWLARVDDWLAVHSGLYSLGVQTFEYFDSDGRSPAAIPFDQTHSVEDAVRAYTRISEQIISRAQRSGARVMFLTPLRNLKDFPPEGGDERLPPMTPAEATASMHNERLSPTGHWQLGRYLLREGQLQNAKEHFEEASNHTTRVGRTHERIETLIRSLPLQHPGVLVLDVERALERELGTPVLGDEALIDWCHLTLTSDFEVARLIEASMDDQLTRRWGPPSRSSVTYQGILERLAPNLEELQTVGLEEAGFLNVRFLRWERAKSFFTRSLAKRLTVKAGLGLALSEARLGNHPNALAGLRDLLRSFPIAGVRHAVGTFYDFDRDYVLELLRQADDVNRSP